MAKQTSPVRMAVRKSEGKQNRKNKKPRSGVDANRQIHIQKALYEIADAASAVMDMESFYRKLHEIVGKLMYAKNFFIATYNEQSSLITWPYYVDTVDVIPPAPIPLSKHHGTTGWILRHGETLADVDGSVAKVIESGEVEMVGSDSDGIGIPLKGDGKTIGVLIVQSYKPNIKYTLEDIEILNFVAQHISTALMRVRAIDETRQRNAELAIINSVQEGLAGKLDMQAIYELVGEKIRNIFNAQVVNIVTYDRTTQLMLGRYYFEDGKVLHGMTLPAFGFRKRVFESYQPIIINRDMHSWMEKYDNPVVQGAQPKSAIFIPMIAGNEVMGVISLQNNDQENAFSEADVRLLGILANSMSIALENARLWEQEKVYRKALERELEIGREIQAGFLPEALPLVAGWEIAASLMSAREVAGDFYDAFELPDGTIGLVMADVCDKGVGAALFMTLFRSLIRAVANLEYFEHTEDPLPSTSERLKRAILLTNNYIAETHGDSGMFATLFFGILDPHDGRLTYINGGHEPPIILQSGIVHDVLRKTGPAVGTIKDGNFGLAETRLQAGDMFVAYTDGVLDCTNSRGEFYGRERLLDVLQNTGGSALELVNAIEADLRQFIAGASQFDDMTLLVARQDSNSVNMKGS